jgi:CBS domain-containing protein
MKGGPFGGKLKETWRRMTASIAHGGTPGGVPSEQRHSVREEDAMQVREIMTGDPICCTRETGLPEVARMMVEHDCGAIPVVESRENRWPVGVITDRDITCRAVAMRRNPLEMTAGDCMTPAAMTVRPETRLEDCERLMEEKQIRRMVVVDERGGCCGMVAQADIARKASEHDVAEVVREVSRPMAAASRM